MSELIIKSGQEKLFEKMKKAGCFKQYASYQEWCKSNNPPLKGEHSEDFNRFYDDLDEKEKKEFDYVFKN